MNSPYGNRSTGGQTVRDVGSLLTKTLGAGGGFDLGFNVELLPPEIAFAGWSEVWSPRLGANWAYQDVARTTPAAANGDPVANVTGWRQSLHMEQAVAGARPVLAAGLRGNLAIQFDGIDDYLRSITSALFNSGDGGGWGFYAILVDPSVANGRIASAVASEVLSDYNTANGFSFAHRATSDARAERLFVLPTITSHATSNTYLMWGQEANSANIYCQSRTQLTVLNTAPSTGFSPDRLFVAAGIDGGLTFFTPIRIQEWGFINRAWTVAERTYFKAWAEGYWGVS